MSRIGVVSDFDIDLQKKKGATACTRLYNCRIECLRTSILVCRIFVGKNKKNGNGQKSISAKINLRKTFSSDLIVTYKTHCTYNCTPTKIRQKSIFVENEKWQESGRRFLSKKFENRKKKFSTKICDKIVDFCRFAMWRGGPVA